jgi:hypothetical protein
VHEILCCSGITDEPSRESVNDGLVPIVHLGHCRRLAVS